MGAPYFKWKDKIEELSAVVLSSNYALYGDMSRRVMQNLRYFAESMEIYSIDEAFVELRNWSNKDLTDYGHEIRRAIYKNTGIPVSVGIAPTKTLAKAANELAKKDNRKDNRYGGVLSLHNIPNIDEFLSTLPVEDVWGVGRQYTKFLNAHGMNTARDLKYAHLPYIKKKMTIQGSRTVRELNGVSCIPLEIKPDPKKGIATTRGFRRPVTEYRELKESIATYVSRATEKLRKQNSVCRKITVFITTDRFKSDRYFNTKTITFNESTSYPSDILGYAIKLLDQMYIPGLKYKKSGVILTDITPANPIQQSLFYPTQNKEKKDRITKALDKINRTMGRDTVVIAQAGVKKKWITKHEIRSPRFTTRWDELLEVR